MMLLLVAETIVTLTAEGDLSNGRLGQPVSLAPDIAHDVTPALRLALVHSRYGLTNMRTSAGGGTCLYGKLDCETYDNVGLEAHYTLSPDVVAMAGLHLLSIDDVDLGLKLGARLSHGIGSRLTLYTTPTVVIPDRAYLPVGAKLRVLGPLALGVETGVTFPLDAPGDFEVPLGGSLQVEHRHVFGGISFTWTKLYSHAEQPANRASIDGLDFRVVNIWVGARW